MEKDGRIHSIDCNEHNTLEHNTLLYFSHITQKTSKELKYQFNSLLEYKLPPPKETN